MNSVIKLLIVDDHQIMIDGIKSMLSSNKNIMVVGFANNGKEAIEFIKKREVDLVLIDVEMPVMNGIDATKVISKSYPEIKIIALTTYHEKSIINAMVEAGASGYVLKNIDSETLQKAILSVVNEKGYFSSDVVISLAKNSLPKNKDARGNLDVFFDPLTKRELEILKGIVDGYTNKEIAKNQYISPKTVETHRNKIMKKLNAHNTATLVKKAIKHGLVD